MVLLLVNSAYMKLTVDHVRVAQVEYEAEEKALAETTAKGLLDVLGHEQGSFDLASLLFRVRQNMDENLQKKQDQWAQEL